MIICRIYQFCSLWGSNVPRHRRQQCVEMMARGQADEMMNSIYKAYDSYKADFDIVLVEGTHEDPRAIGTPSPASNACQY